jgi:hypothetical protein
MSESETLAEKLQAEGQKLIAYMGSLDADSWCAQVYADGAVWTTRSVFAHLLAAEKAFIQLFSQIRLGGSGVSEDFDIDRYNASQHRKMAELPPEDVMQQFGDFRAQMVAMVSTLSASDLDRRGRHPFLGTVTLREMIRMIYIHGQTHARDVRRALAKV